MQRKVPFAVDEHYHLYNRGTDKRTIFLDEADGERFTKLLYLCNGEVSILMRDLFGKDDYTFERGETLVDIGAYCLMPNHFHLLVKEKKEGGISMFMKKLSTAYSMYFNKKYDRSGGLFQGRFKSQHADEDRYLKYLFSYVHLNPVKLIDPLWKEKGISDKEKAKYYLGSYKYSSFLDYMGHKRKEGAIINKEAFPEYFSKTKDFNDFIDEWLSFIK